MPIVQELLDRLRREEPPPGFDLAECDDCGILVINPAGTGCPKCAAGELVPIEP